MDAQQISDFFSKTLCKIWGNQSLRVPQIEGYFAIQDHFKNSGAPCYVQLPVGCGKTGLMGLTPFGLAKGRVLMIAPNLTIRQTIKRELNIGDPNCFFKKRNVFAPKDGPFISELKTGANIHDCDAAHIVIANIQQFRGANNKWYESLSPDYFDMILVDEGHHNVADTWRRLFDYFSEAKVVSFTATPLRSDGQIVAGERVYRFGYARSMIMGFISPIEAVFVTPKEITFTADGETKQLSLEERPCNEGKRLVQQRRCPFRGVQQERRFCIVATALSSARAWQPSTIDCSSLLNSSCWSGCRTLSRAWAQSGSSAQQSFG